MTSNGIVKLTVNLPEETVEKLREMAKEQNTTMTEILRRAIGTQKFLRDATKAGSKVLLEDPGHKYRQIIFQ